MQVQRLVNLRMLNLRDVVAVSVSARPFACGMVLLSPMSSKSHFCVLLLPATYLALELLEARTRQRSTLFLWVGIFLLVALGSLTSKGILGRTQGNLLLALRSDHLGDVSRFGVDRDSSVPSGFGDGLTSDGWCTVAGLVFGGGDRGGAASIWAVQSPLQITRGW